MALLIRIYYNAVFGALGGLIGWMLYGVFGDKNPTSDVEQFQNILVGVILGGMIAFWVVSVDAIRDRSLARFARYSSYGILLGALGGALGALMGENIKYIFDKTFELGSQTGWARVGPTMVARGIGWIFLGVAVGMSEGIAARSMGKFSYGMIGGAVGGFIGGALYGWFLEIASQAEGTTYFWAAMGLVIMGACIGSLTALVRAVFQPASVKVLRGWQEGREYPLDKSESMVGRHEHADIALFRDMKIEKEHAYIRWIGGNRYVLYNNSAPPENTLVNQNRVAQARELFDGDRIQLGNVILRFQMRAAVNRKRPARKLPVIRAR